MTHPIFEDSSSPLHHSNDGRLAIRREPSTKPQGWAVVDESDLHVEFFTLKREIADAFIAGYDYRERLNRAVPQGRVQDYNDVDYVDHGIEG